MELLLNGDSLVANRLCLIDVAAEIKRIRQGDDEALLLPYRQRPRGAIYFAPHRKKAIERNKAAPDLSSNNSSQRFKPRLARRSTDSASKSEILAIPIGSHRDNGISICW